MTTPLRRNPIRPAPPTDAEPTGSDDPNPESVPAPAESTQDGEQ